ncbi:zinc finger protein 207 [Phaffia rhodozyma]|uniref:Zinc finger protein 207 n=1 Tax=Phaffia rhodozyma TaxID=264483 RepID=A0A0F7SG90_PHARH|nr:zinc finger protein 207 [Phaffia rhodozyma]
MGKRKSKSKQLVQKPVCYYCEREFEDEKVLMQHQKAKHFKCRLCPRKLNTAGGLAVHIQQVHKLEPEKLDNCLPGRDGYDVEIFGMEGFPADALKEYRQRKAEEAGINPQAAEKKTVKRVRISYAPISEADLQAQLKAHIALMKGPVSGGVMAPPPGFGLPPPGLAGGIPPPSFAFPPGGGGMGMPPMPPPGMFRPPFPLPGPPPGWRPGMPVPPFPQAGGPFPPPSALSPFPPAPGQTSPFPPPNGSSPFPPPSSAAAQGNSPFGAPGSGSTPGPGLSPLPPSSIAPMS